MNSAADDQSGGFEMPLENSDQTFAHALWVQQTQLDLTVELAQVLERFVCQETAEAVDDELLPLEGQLWQLAEKSAADLQSGFLNLLSLQQQRIAERWSSEENPNEREAGAVRALHDSRLAAARLLVAVPRRLYSDADQGVDALGDVFDRFPVVATPAPLAEAARADSLLRASGLHPLLPDLSLQSGVFSSQAFLDAAYGNELSERLRERLLSIDPAAYQGLPGNASAFLGALGLTRLQLGEAAVRLVQLSEARAHTLRPIPDSTPVQIPDADAKYPAPLAPHLYALTEGRAPLATDAWPSAAAARGVFHAIGALERAMAQRILQAQDWSLDERKEREHLRGQIATHAARPSVSLMFAASSEVSPAPVVELLLSEEPGSDVLERYEVWWTDAGALCATVGKVAGHVCDESEFRFSTSQAKAEVVGVDASGSHVVRLAGFTWPTPSNWDPALTTERTRGRVYVTRKIAGAREVIGAASLEPSLVSRTYVQPNSEELASYLRELLAYREPGEGCGDCRPSSVCEQTACTVGLCLRTQLSDRTCGAEGQCVAGVCDKPGCGDGARSDGEDGVPFEACDDGNLEDGDGCSALCSVETRVLEPVIQEGWPSGPAPAVAVDGLGNALLVYLADDLSGETVRIRAIRFDSFGHQDGTEFDLETDIARGYEARPTVAGLSQGGFAVVFASAQVQGESALGFRLVDTAGNATPIASVDANGSVQTNARVAAFEDGFVVTWVERGTDSDATKVRLRRIESDGEPYGPSVDVSSNASGVAQGKPAMATSLGQILVAWSEVQSATNTALGTYARRCV
ncbi:MAG: myxococcus cysteine-rich repeat containing protein [Myxococcales bacterium]